MIFRIDGEVGELIALTPILREWRRRNVKDDILVETMTPDIFDGNPDVTRVGHNIYDLGPCIDINLVRWPVMGTAVEEVYAELIFGDKNLHDWRPRMYASEEQLDFARKMIPTSGKKAAVAFDEKMISPQAADGAIKAVVDAGYELLMVDDIRPLNGMFAVISMAQLFVGSDGCAAAIALTTDVPAVVCYSYRSPVYFPPYRQNIPFVAVTPDKGLCECAPTCLSRHGHYEFSRVYTPGCIAKDPFCCMNRNLTNDVSMAIRRVEHWVN